MDTHNTWRITRLISLYKEKSTVFNKRTRNLFICAILKVAQWALDNSTEIPSLDSFRKKLRETINEFIIGALDYFNNGLKMINAYLLIL